MESITGRLDALDAERAQAIAAQPLNKERGVLGTPLHHLETSTELAAVGRGAGRLQDANKVAERYVWWAGQGLTCVDEVGGCPRAARCDALRPLPEAVRRV